MKRIKVGDIVSRKSYNNDILFRVKRILNKKNDKIVILSGVIERVEADCNIKDLELASSDRVNNDLLYIQGRIDNKAGNKLEGKRTQYIITGKILHLDGDRKYSEKSYRYYKKLGLNAIVKNIPEYKQSKVVYNLLRTYEPDILIITGHDSMIKNGKNYLDIYNYRNSKYFINSVLNARKWQNSSDKLVIFARSLPKLL